MAQVFSVEYQGHLIPLGRTYSDLDEYKDDPDNLAPAQVKQIESLIRQAPFGPRFHNLGELQAAIERIQFPGYGSFLANQLLRSSDHLELAYVEIPKRDLNRYFIVERSESGALIVVEDFVAEAWPEITSVRREGTKVVYLNASGEPVHPQRVP